MLLTIDIGNTLIDFGLWKGEELTLVYQAAAKPIRSEDEYRSVVELFLQSKRIDPHEVDDAILSSVVPPLATIFRKITLDVFGIRPKVVGPRLKTGIAIRTDNPAEVGADLVADAVGGLARYGTNLFLADLGTANKFIYVDQNGAFAGCAIAPGLAQGAASLSRDTAALPLASLLRPRNVIGTNTNDSMNAGILYTNVYAVEGFLKEFEKEAGVALKPILTGGNAVFVKDLLPSFTYDPNLLLYGLKEIARRNRK